MEPNGREHRRTALVLFGTETGTAQDLGEEVGRVLARLHFHVDVASCDNANYEDILTYDLTVILIATTGQGDFPANARRLWSSLLRKKLPPTLLSGVNYALVGLCDSSYLKFNYAARKLGKRLLQLGAKEILEACEADEQGDDGTDGAFLPWLDHFRSVLLAKYPLPTSVEVIPDTEPLPSTWRLQRAQYSGYHDVSPSKLDRSTDSQDSAMDILHDSFPATLELNDRVTPSSHWQEVRLFRLRTSTEIEYFPGDALAITPENMPQDVDELIGLMCWHEVADEELVVQSCGDSSRVTRLRSPPVPLDPDISRRSLRTLLTKYLDINSIPRRSFFSAIARYATDPTQQERLLEFTEPQYLDEYYDYATRPRRSIIEVLQEFDSVKIPWQEAINVFPTLTPRQFSLASGGLSKSSAKGTNFELLVAIVKYRTVIKRIREGVCTRYLAQLPVGTTLQVALRTEGRFFGHGQVNQTHQLLIGAGTGIAPLRALLHEKQSQPSQNTESILIFGARNAHADYFFADDLERFSDSSSARHGLPGFEVHTAFSRDQPQKFYVQDRIREQHHRLRPFVMHPNTVIIVCGASGQMPKAVRQALVDILSLPSVMPASERPESEGNSVATMTVQDAELFITTLEKQGRYKQETWS